MEEILVLVEHRRGEIRDITYEMLARASELAEGHGARLVALLLGSEVSRLAPAVATRAEVVETYEDPKLAEFNSDSYQRILSARLRERPPRLLMIGHTSYGIELAPNLATSLDLPLITDAIEVALAEDGIVAVRPVYSGKARARVRARGASAIVTVQSGAFAQAAERETPGEVVRAEVGLAVGPGARQFLGFVEAPAEDVDITQSDIVVSVGRGIGDPENLPLVEELAAALGGVLACSRPVVDRKWLPRSRQVGISGKVVQPRLYLAVGISGAFQHLAGMKGAKNIVAINKDPEAPIFRIADYGIVGDLFQVVPALTERVAEARRK